MDVKMDVKNKNYKIKYSVGDKIYYLIVDAVLAIFTLCIIFPLINIVAASFSSPTAVATSRVVLWPVDFSLAGYKAVFSNPYVLTGYRNTIIYTIVGTWINVGITLLAA